MILFFLYFYCCIILNYRKFTLSFNLNVEGVLKVNPDAFPGSPEAGVAVEAVVADTGVL